jgi:NADH-quinone oxidoreductase subunit L
VAGQILIDPMLFSHTSLLGNSIFVLPEHNVIGKLALEHTSAMDMALEAGKTLTFWLAIAGIVTAWLFKAMYPHWSTAFTQRFSLLYAILLRKYGFDDFNQIVFVHGTRDTGRVFYEVSDVKVIDGVCVNGSGRFVRWFAQVSRHMQTGYIYTYALAMVLGVLVFLIWYMGGF